MIINYNDVFYKFIECFLHLDRPNKIIIENPNDIYNLELINQYKHITRDELDYTSATMILLDSNHFTDEAFIYFFPMLIKHILDQNGLLEAVINRLNIIDITQFSKNENEVILEMIKILEEINNQSNESSEEIILII